MKLFYFQHFRISDALEFNKVLPEQMLNKEIKVQNM